MLLMLGSGLILWVIYGVIRADWVILLANSISLLLLACILYFRVRSTHGRRWRHGHRA